MKKRIIALSLVLVMFFSALPLTAGASVFGKTADSMDVEGKMSISIDISGADVPAEVIAAIGMFSNIEMNYIGTYILKSDLEMQIYLRTVTGVGIFQIPLNIWMDMNFTDMSDPVFLIIAEVPAPARMMLSAMGIEIPAQFLYFDYFEMMRSIPGLDMNSFMLGMEQGLAMVEQFAEWGEDLLSELFAGIIPEALGENHYRVTISNAQAKEMAIKFIDSLMYLMLNDGFIEDIMRMQMSALFGDADDIELILGMSIDELIETTVAELTAIVENELPKIYRIINQVEIFTGDGIVFEYKLNADGYYIYQSYDINLKIDILDWAHSISAEFPGLFDMSVVPDVTISLSIQTEETYTNLGSAQIEFPALTPENSLNLSTLITGMFAPGFDFDPIVIFVNSEHVLFPDAKPEIINDRTMVPASILFRALGGDMTFEEIGYTQIITGYMGENTVQLTIGSDVALVNGVEVNLDVPAFINAEHRTMVPLRFIAENFGLNVEFENISFTVSGETRYQMYIFIEA